MEGGMKEERRKLVQVRLPVELVKELDHWAVESGVTRQEAVRQLIERGLREGVGG